MSYLGSHDVGDTVVTKFTTVNSSGVPTSFAASPTPAISVYKDSDATQSTAGVTLTQDFDSLTGLHNLAIDTSADATFYSAGSHFVAVIASGTVDGVDIAGYKVAEFDLGGVLVGEYTSAALSAIQNEANSALISYDAATDADVATVTAALTTDTYAEPGQETPPATTTLIKKIGYLYKFLRNKVEQDDTEMRVYADNASTVDQKSTTGVAGDTFSRGEFTSGP